MNTKNLIENKKISDILKGALAAGLVVGSMLTSTACKPNQPHESTSNTSTIETTTTATPIIEDPDKEIKIKRNELINMIENRFKNSGNKFDEAEKIIFLSKYSIPNNQFAYWCYVGALFQKEKNLVETMSTEITEEEYIYLVNNVSPNASQEENAADFIIRFSDNYNDEHQGIKESTKNINEIEDEKVLDIILDSFSKSLSEDQQDDPVR